MSETSSNLSYVTSSAFKPKQSQLDVIREINVGNEGEEDDSDQDNETGHQIGVKARTGSNKLVGHI